jgi:hypothetical protein
MEKEPPELTPEERIDQELWDAETPGYKVDFDPDEAERIDDWSLGFWVALQEEYGAIVALHEIRRLGE